MINMAQGFYKGQFGKSMHRFEAITTSDLAPPAELGLLWILAEQEMVIFTIHDNILNIFITLLCLPAGKFGFVLSSQQQKLFGLQDIAVTVY